MKKRADKLWRRSLVAGHLHTTCVLGRSCTCSQAHILCAWSHLDLVASTHSSWNQGGTQKSSNLGGSFNKIRAGVLILRAPGSFVHHFEKAELNICLSSAWTNLLLQKTYIQREILSRWFSVKDFFGCRLRRATKLPAFWLSHKKSGAYNLSLYSWQSVLVVVPMCLGRLSSVVPGQVLMLTHATGWLDVTEINFNLILKLISIWHECLHKW